MSFCPLIGGIFMSFEALLGKLATGEKMTPIIRGRYVWYAVGSIVADCTLVGIPMSSLGKLWFRFVTMRQIKMGTGILGAVLNNKGVQAALGTTPVGKGVVTATNAMKIKNNVQGGVSGSGSTKNRMVEMSKRVLSSKLTNQKIKNTPSEIEKSRESLEAKKRYGYEQGGNRGGIPSNKPTAPETKNETLEIPQKTPNNLARKTNLLQKSIKQGKLAEKEVLEKIEEKAPDTYKAIIKKLYLDEIGKIKNIIEKSTPKTAGEAAKQVQEAVLNKIKQNAGSSHQ